MEDPQRPLPPRSPSERARGWIEWFGLGRIVASALAMVIVCAGAYWLVRIPPPPTEAMLPVVTPTTPAPAGPPTTGAPGAESAPDSATGATLGSPSVIFVHVAGAVAMPGVYELDPNARVQGAIVAAGGPLPDADPNTLNLAAPLSDGARIYVPRIGEVVPPTVAMPGPQPNASTDPAGDGAPTVVDVNTASAVELEALPGVGPATATAIVAERDRNGPFLSVDDLDRVPGIGPTKIEALRELVST